MLVEVSKRFTHSYNTAQRSRYSAQELLEMRQRNGLQSDRASIGPDSALQVDGKAYPKFHRITLKAEELGLKLKYTKKTLIEIC